MSNLEYFSKVLFLILIICESRCVPFSEDAQGALYQNQRSQSMLCYPSATESLDIPDTISTLAQPLNDWWCSQQNEYGWLGFSYDVSDCPSHSEMVNTCKWMQSTKKARYVRVYGGCDADGFDNDVIEAAANTGVGVYALIWFGFDDDDKWKGRKERLLKAIRNNPKAPCVIRAVTCSSEPLFDNVMPVEDLVAQIQDLKKNLKPLGIQVTLSEMPSGYQAKNHTPGIFQAVDFVSLHSFGFFDQTTTTADRAEVTVRRDVGYGLQHGGGKKVVITQTGWPSNTDVWKANSPKAVSNLAQEALYFEMLDRHYPKVKPSKSSNKFAEAELEIINFENVFIAHSTLVYNDSSLPG